MTPELELIQTMIRARISSLWERKQGLKDEHEFVLNLPNEDMSDKTKDPKKEGFHLSDVKLSETETKSSKSIVDIISHWCNKIQAKVQNNTLTEVDALKLKKIIDIIYIENK